MHYVVVLLGKGYSRHISFLGFSQKLVVSKRFFFQVFLGAQAWGTLIVILMYTYVIPIFNNPMMNAGWPENPKELWYGGGPFNGGWYYYLLFTGIGLNLWLLLNFLLVGARFFVYFKFHPGVSKSVLYMANCRNIDCRFKPLIFVRKRFTVRQMGVFVRIFERTFKIMQDFIIWFFALGLWMSTFFWIFNSITGGNELFITFGDSLVSFMLFSVVLPCNDVF